MRFWTASRFASALLIAALSVSATPAHVAQDAAQAPKPKAPEAKSPEAKSAEAKSPDRPADASALFAAFAKVEGLEARFEEEKHLALLAVPLATRGKLYFMRPGYLVRLVESPEASRLVITPAELKLAGRDGEQRIDLKQRDDVRLFVTSIVQVLLGDEAALKSVYAIAFEAGSADASSWALTLTPLGPPLSKLMQTLTLRGEGLVVRSIELLEPGGDRTFTRILEANSARRFTKEEQAELFEIRRQ